MMALMTSPSGPHSTSYTLLSIITGPIDLGTGASDGTTGVSGTITVTFTGPERGFNIIAEYRAPEIISAIATNTAMSRGMKFERSFFAFMSYLPAYCCALGDRTQKPHLSAVNS
jgi:hypothetical protein